jgi:glycosyltransferase involved in cell wall biosynthesis
MIFNKVTTRLKSKIVGKSAKKQLVLLNKPKNEGCLDGLFNGNICGWLTNENGEPCHYEIYVNGISIAQGFANLYRADLANETHGGYVGFSCSVDEIIKVEELFLSDSLQIIIRTDHNKIINNSLVLENTLDEYISHYAIGNIPNKEIISAIRTSGLWDDSFYINRYLPSGFKGDPLLHYVLFGWKKNHKSSPYFSQTFYKISNHDAGDLGLIPLYHYIVIGEREGRKPNDYFSAKDYLAINPDLVSYEGNLLGHYVHHGKFEDRKIKGELSTDVFANPAKNKVDDILLSESHEKNEDSKVILQDEKYTKEMVDVIKPYFDVDFYLENNHDVSSSEMDPFLHFLSHGLAETRACNQQLDLEYVFKYLNDTNQVDKDYLSVILEHTVQFDDVDEESFFIDYDQKITAEELQKIKELGLFSEDYYLSFYPDVKKSEVNPLLHYLYFGFNEDRSPSFSFDSSFYRKNYQRNKKLCPLIHYIRFGGHSHYNVLPPNALNLKSFNLKKEYGKKVAIQIHLYYSDTLIELLPFLCEIKDVADLFISTTTADDHDYINNKLKKAGLLEQSDVRIVKNIGRDIAPLFVEFKEIWSNYDYVCHLHSKKSPHTQFGHRWRSYLFDQLIGDAKKLHGMLNYLEANPDVGVLYPDNYFEIKKFIGDNGNEGATKSLLSKIGIDYQSEKLSGVFPAGSMCLLRASAFDPLSEIKLELVDFQSEDGQVEGTLAHVLERCLTIIPELLGYKASPFYTSLAKPSLFSNRWNRKDVFKKATAATNTASRWLRDTPDIALNKRLVLKPQYPYYNPDSLCIHWIIPDFGIGAGGHMTIFRMIKFLEEFGHRQIIWIQNARNYATPKAAKECIQFHYQSVGDNVIVQFLPEDVGHISGDVVIATDCWTTFPMMEMERFKERFYLIQDWEPMFHPVGDSHMIANLTYEFNLNALCAGKWLYSKAKEKGLWARSWDLASDEKYYYPKETSNKPKFQVTIAFYARAYTSRRAVMLGVAALKALHARGVDVHVQFFGQEGIDFGVEFSHEYLGILSPKELGDVYRNADIGLVFSATNYSLIPLEMMACQLPVVELNVESTRAVFDETFIEMVNPDPLALADRLEFLINNPEQLSVKSEKALKYTQKLSWESSARIIEKGIKDKLSEHFTAIDSAEIFEDKKTYKYKASVIIPTYNAGEEFKEVIKALLGQKCDFSYEIVIVDSGSTDSTIDLVRKFKEKTIKLIEIPNSDFQHGRTRNYAISKTQGEYVVVMTQDATPKNELWLAELINAFEKAPEAVGAFGAHQAYPEHSPFMHRDIDQVFNNYNHLGEKYFWAMKLPAHVEQGSVQWQFLLQFYSDNNSCMKKAAWEQIPYPEIDWGEDQAWGWMIIQLGLTKAYAKDAIVLHSHDDNYDTKYKVSKTEGQFFRNNFSLNLYSEDADINKIIKHAQDNDTEFAKQNNVSAKQLARQLSLIEAAHSGRFVGCNEKPD